MGEVVHGIDQEVMSQGVPPEEGPGPGQPIYPGFRPGRETSDGLVIDRDVAVQMRDGVTIYVDLYRPEGVEEPLPAIMLWSAYGKHHRWWPQPAVPGEVDLDSLSEHCVFECPDPARWCPEGYAFVVPDPRGICGSEGEVSVWSPQEREDSHDTIEWIAEQSWCTGKVGMAGASYYGWSQWHAGVERPPHLAALLPYDGASDPYRDFAFHGGIPNMHFMTLFSGAVRMSNNRAEELLKGVNVHPLLDEYWESKRPALEQIDVPTYVVSSFADHGVHTRGTIEGFRRIGSEHKWLELHGQKKWSRLYSEKSLERQLAFFDRFLHDTPNEVDSWPLVRLEVREHGTTTQPVRAESEWPLARTEYVPLYLDAQTATASTEVVEDESSVTYDATATEITAMFTHTFAEATELTGYAKLRLWVSADGSDDMDLFVAMQKLDTSGQVVNFPFFSMHDDGQVALGWQRVSHRELDEELSTPQQPVHTHRREERLSPGEIVPVEIELWPSSTAFGAGEQLRVLVKGTDIQYYELPKLAAAHPETRNAGHHTIHTGGRCDSHLLVPVIPSVV